MWSSRRWLAPCAALVAQQAVARMMIAITALLLQFAGFWLFTFAPHLGGIDGKKLLKLFRGFRGLRGLCFAVE